MAKRGANGVQGGRDGDGSHSRIVDEDDAPLRADASVIAGRKILAPKARRTPTPTPGSPGFSSASGALGNIFGGATSNAMSGSTSSNKLGPGFGQQQPSSPFGAPQAPPSFPPANFDPTFGQFGGLNTQNVFGSGQNSTAPTTGFSFGGNASSIFRQPQAATGGNTTSVFGQTPQAASSSQSSFSRSSFTQPPGSSSTTPSFGGFGQTRDVASSNNDTAMQISPEVSPKKNNTDHPSVSSLFGTSFTPSGATNTVNMFGQKSITNSLAQLPTSPFSSQPAVPRETSAAMFGFSQNPSPANPAASQVASPSFNFLSVTAQPSNLGKPSSPFTFGAPASSEASVPNQFSFGSGSPSASKPQTPSTTGLFGSNNNKGSAALPQISNASPSSTTAQRASESVASPLKLEDNTKFSAAPSLASPPASPLAGYPPGQEAKFSMGSATSAPITTQNASNASNASNATPPTSFPASSSKLIANTSSALTDAQNAIHKAHRELRSLNSSFRTMIATMDPGLDWSGLMHAYLSQYIKLTDSRSSDMAVETPKRKAIDDLPKDSEKRAKPIGLTQSPSQNPPQEKSQTANLFQSLLDNGKADKSVNASSPFVPNPSYGTPFAQPPQKSAAPALSPFASAKTPEAQSSKKALAPTNPFASLKASAPANPFNSLKAPQAQHAITSGSSNPFANLSAPSATPQQPVDKVINKSTNAPLSANNAGSSPFVLKSIASVAPNAVPRAVASAVPPTTATAFKVPTFGGGGAAPVNFMAQFGKAADKEAEKEKAKRKAEEFDSDEDNEAEWEKNYAEEQLEKKAKLAAEAKAKTATFVPGKGFSIKASDTTKLPISDAGQTSVNFLAQFGQAANKEAAKEKAKRKAEEFDSDEDDEAEWERIDAEKQRQKKVKLGEDAKSKVAKFVAGKGFVIEEADEPSSTSPKADPPAADSTSISVLDRAVQDNPDSITSYIFGKPSNEAAGHWTKSQNDSASEPDSENETLENATRKPIETSAPVKSLFDRITPAEEAGEPTEANTKPKPLFNFSTPGDSGFKFATSSANAPETKTSPAGDNTWKVDSPIKFASNPGPIFNLEASTPTKPSIFAGNPSTTPAGKPLSNPFSITGSSSTTGLFNQPPATSLGFNFGGPPKSDPLPASSFLFPSGTKASNASSTSASRAASPGTDSAAIDSGNDTAAEGDAEKPLAQTELTGLSEVEKRDEELLFEVKALCKQFVKSVDTDSNGSSTWESKGTGPFRILKHRQTGVSRILLRAAPSGRVVINSRVLQDPESTLRGPKFVQFTILGTNGDPQTWSAQVGKPDDATRLVNALNNNRPT